MAMPSILRSIFSSSSAPATTPSTGGTLVSSDGRALPLRDTALEARAKGGVARTVVRQTFVNPYDDALEVRYQLPLPADGAVSGFRFELDGVEVLGEVDRKARARERYEEAIVSGHTAALLEQDRPNLFSQRVGNIPPKSTVVAEVTVDQRLAWLDEGAWEWRFPTVAGPRYLGAEGRVADAHRVHVEVADEALPHALSLSLAVADAIPSGHRPESPTHALSVSTHPNDGLVARFADAQGQRLDRDVVVRWPVAEREPGLSLDVVRAPEKAADAGSSYGLLTIVPPQAEGRMKALPRDLIFLIDTSGSMGGRPLEQAARVAAAMIDTLSDHDRIELIEFASSPRRWKPSAVAATDDNRRAAIAWVTALRAGGATEMRAALLEALKPLRAGAQRQVVLITDGYIGFEREIVETVFQKLPGDCRLHTLGVGSSVNRALTGPAAQAGRGVEVVVGLDEDVEPAARRLVERTNAPLVTELVIDGEGVVEASPARLPDLFAASPVLISLRLGAPGSTLRVRGKTARGSWEQLIRVPEAPSYGCAPAVRARFGRDRVEDHELHLAAGGFVTEIDRAIEELGVGFQIATRLTSWVAVSRGRTVDPEAKRRSENMPQEMVYGLSAEGLGLRSANEQDDLALTRAGMSMNMVSTRRARASSGRARMEAPAPSQAPGAPPPPRQGGPLGAPGGMAPPPPSKNTGSAPMSPIVQKGRTPAPEEVRRAASASEPFSAPEPAPMSKSEAPSASVYFDEKVATAAERPEPQVFTSEKRVVGAVWVWLMLLALTLVAAWFVYRVVADDDAREPTPRPTETRTR